MMKFLLLMLAFLSFIILVFSSAEEENLEPNPNEGRSKRATNYYDPSYGSNKDSNCGSGINDNDLYDPPYCKPAAKCRSPESLPIVNSYFLGGRPRQYYLTMASCYGGELYSSVLLNRAPRTNQEVNEMCISLFLDRGLLYIDGYGKQFGLNCTLSDNSKGLKCNFSQEMSDDSVDTEIYTSVTIYPIATDNYTFILYYACLNNLNEIVVLATTRPYVDKSVVSKVMDVVSQLRMPIDQLKIFQCHPPSYPYPFQNYPQNSCSSSQYSTQGSCSSSSPAPSYKPPNYGESKKSQHKNYNHPPQPSPYYDGPDNYY